MTEENKWTPLHYASREGHLGIVKLLIVHGADVNAKDMTNRTPLDQAYVDEQKSIISFLRGKGGIRR